jgi:hypothetical protein
LAGDAAMRDAIFAFPAFCFAGFFLLVLFIAAP